jgi:hypothetical protein
MDKNFREQLANLWADEFVRLGSCCLCGNSGIIDTRNVMFDEYGDECGAEVFCICPNGRELKSKEELRAFAVAEKLND